MTVAQLIAELHTMTQEAEVMVPNVHEGRAWVEACPVEALVVTRTSDTEFTHKPVVYL